MPSKAKNDFFTSTLNSLADLPRAPNTGKPKSTVSKSFQARHRKNSHNHCGPQIRVGAWDRPLVLGLVSGDVSPPEVSARSRLDQLSRVLVPASNGAIVMQKYLYKHSDDGTLVLWDIFDSCRRLRGHSESFLRKKISLGPSHKEIPVGCLAPSKLNKIGEVPGSSH